MLDLVVNKVQSLLPRKKVDIFGKGQLMHSSLPYYLLSVLMLSAYWGNIDTGFGLIFLVYTVLPLLDEFFSLDIKNPTEQERKDLQRKDLYFKAALYVTVICDWALFFKAMQILSQIEINPWSFVKLASFIFIFSNVNSIQFAVAHEIFHKPGKFNRYLGTVHMVKNLYMHFTYEHLFGHHRRVATPDDPASAAKGQNVYRFFVKSFLGSFKSVYEMEKKEGKSFFTNYSVLSVLSSILFTALMFKIFGIQGGILFLVEAFGSIFYLEAINYIEHYGLRREKLANGQYEKVTIRHSWNAPHRFSNYLLFKLQRHSDHHENSLKPYQTLVSLEESPHLPHGYSVCIFMSFFPSTWFKVMDPLVDEYNTIKFGNINGETMKKSMSETRKFIIRMGFATAGFFLFTLKFM